MITSTPCDVIRRWWRRVLIATMESKTYTGPLRSRKFLYTYIEIGFSSPSYTLRPFSKRFDEAVLGIGHVRRNAVFTKPFHTSP